jgi:hypothetical protein
MVMAVLLLDYYEGGNVGITSAFSLVQTLLLAVLIGIAHFLSRGGADTSASDAPDRNEEGGNLMANITRRQFSTGAAAAAAAHSGSRMPRRRISAATS